METKWELFECEKGNRWSQVVNGVDSTNKDGQTCYFSGCGQDHKIKLVKKEADRIEAHDWFRKVA